MKATSFVCYIQVRWGLDLLEIKVLDHGYVKLIDKMGDDCTPAESARLSYAGTRRGWDEGDGRLTKRLLKDRHTSPFEFNEIVFEIQAPIFIARQMVRHRTANWSEFSMRYSDASKLGSEILIYAPSSWEHSGSMEERPQEGRLAELAFEYRAHAERARWLYRQLVENGVAKETARIVLPVSTYTRWKWKMDFHNLNHFLKLRTAMDAQPEMREYANAIKDLTKQIWPRLVEASEQVAT